MKKYSFLILVYILSFSLLSCASPSQKLAKNKAAEQNMIVVPGGWFLMGSETGEVNERFSHEVYIDSYYIDRHEVTARDFAEFLDAKGNLGNKYYSFNDRSTVIAEQSGEGSDKDGERYTPRQGYENHPANNVSWFGADAYCRWRGTRLPTEAEWEKAAKGTDERTYPWGYDEPDETKARFNQTWDENGMTVMVPVHANPEGASFYGAYGMAGNVWEWTGDWYRQNYCDYCDPAGGDYEKIASEIIGKDTSVSEGEEAQSPPRKNPRGPSVGVFKVLRGGSWDDRTGNTIRTTYRYWLDPEKRFSDTGFRCASTTLPEIEEKVEVEVPEGEIEEPVVPPVTVVVEVPDVEIPVISSFEPIFFDFDKYDIREDAKPTLQKVYEWMEKFPFTKMLVEGHCDEWGSNEYNIDLGIKRARTAKAYLIRKGIEPDRVDVETRGENMPFCFIRDRGCWQSNRRVNFVPVVPPE